MAPNLIQRVQDRLERFFVERPNIFSKNETTKTPDAVVDYKPSPIASFTHEIEKIVEQMMELEGTSESFKAHTYINEVGKRTFGGNRKLSGNILAQAMETAEATFDDMVASFNASYGGALNWNPGSAQPKYGEDGREFEDSKDLDLSLSDNRSSVALYDGTVLTYTKVVNSDKKVEAVRPKVEITTPDGGKLTANLSDTDGLKRILDESHLSVASVITLLDPLKQMIAASRNILVDAQINGIMSTPDFDKMMNEARPGPNGPN